MNVEIIAKKVKTKEKEYTNYYIKCDNGVHIAIKPSFVTDYGKLRVVAKLVADDEKK